MRTYVQINAFSSAEQEHFTWARSFAARGLVPSLCRKSRSLSVDGNKESESTI